MTTDTNQSKYAKSEICKTCGNCCKFFEIIVSPDEGVRYSWLNQRKIKVKEIKTATNTNYCIVRFNFPCEKLKQDKQGNYYCDSYENRPHFCKEYPDNIPIALMDYESSFCPIIKEVNK